MAFMTNATGEDEARGTHIDSALVTSDWRCLWYLVPPPGASVQSNSVFSSGKQQNHSI